MNLTEFNALRWMKRVWCTLRGHPRGVHYIHQDDVGLHFRCEHCGKYRFKGTQT